MLDMTGFPGDRHSPGIPIQQDQTEAECGYEDQLFRRSCGDGSFGQLQRQVPARRTPPPGLPSPDAGGALMFRRYREPQELRLRALLVTTVIAAGAGLAVLLFFDEFHGVLLPALAVQEKWGAAVGMVVTVVVASKAQRVVSLLFYRDALYGVSRHDEKASRRASSAEEAGEQVAGELRQVTGYNEVVRNQLGVVVQETEKAAFDIAERLQAIDQLVSGINSYADASASESNEMLGAAEQRIAQNRQLIATLESYIQQRMADSETDRQRVQQVVDKTQTLQSLVDLIRQISTKTNLLALNASIEAARAGETGRGFAVVADQVRKLSDSTQEAVTQIAEGIRVVTQNIEAQFADKLSSSSIDAERTALQGFSAQLEDLGRNYKEVTDHETQVLNNLRNDSQKLAAAFMDALASIQFQDVTRQQIEHVGDALKRLDAHSEHLADRLQRFDDPHFELSPLAKQLDEIYGAYVMSSQRSTHLAALGAGAAGGAGSDGPKVELF